jgi:hypothetical protein
MNKKLGYYSVGLHQFDSKIKACQLASLVVNQTNAVPSSVIKWNFNDEFFKQYDWSCEPSQTLTELYNKRAKNLREKYDYIIVSYSGGSDSHNILMSFLNQGLFVDEIVVTHMNKAMNNYAQVDFDNRSPKYAYSSEYKLQTLPRLEEIKLLSPNTKIKIFDVSDSVFSAFSKRMDESWVHHVREELNPIDASRYNYLQFSEFKSQLDFGKKIAIVLGVDKPIVKLDKVTNKFYLCFVDRMANITPIGEYAKDYTNTTIEYFYWSPDACDLLCKQAHTIVNWLKLHPEFQQYFCCVPTHRMYSERILRPLIYKTWSLNWFQADKAMFDWHSTFDAWFIENHNNSLEFSLWKKGIIYVSKTCKPFLFNPQQPDGLIHFEKRYEIATI